MKKETVSLKEAQRLILASQKLIGPALQPRQIIEHLGYIQIDTISVVERAHHHTFWVRNQSYRPNDLDVLVQERIAFEYWSHAASFLPMNEYRYSLPMKRAFRKKTSSWFPRDTKLMSYVLQRIRNEGPLQSKDFKQAKKTSTGWWDWKPAKKALERLFLEGDLEISCRDGFQKVYDLPERVIPNFIDTAMPTEKEYIRFIIQRALRYQGLASIDEIAYLSKKETKTKVAKEINEMLVDGSIQKIKVDKLLDPYFILPNAFGNLPRISSKIFILSPFDNLVIQRKKLKSFFNFDYQIECYIPAPKRKFGYFCLPIFEGSRPVARIDCKADRKNKKLLIHSVHYEQNVDRDLVEPRLESKLKYFAKFNGCNSMVKI